MEIMIVIAILGVVMAIAGTTWIRQRQLSQVRACQENLIKIQGVKEQWALENNKPPSLAPTWNDLVQADGGGYLKRRPECPASGTYQIGTLYEAASCTVVAPIDHNEY